MAENTRPPDQIDLTFHRDRERRLERSSRWLVLVTLTAISSLGLAGVFGQRVHTSTEAAAAATFRVTAPHALRSGLVFQGRFEIDARRAIERPTLVLHRGWFESLTVNTLEPAPLEESSEDGGVALEFGRLAAGQELTVYVQFQVNPTTVSRRSQDAELRDGDRTLARVERAITIYP
ncbi:MAG: hypothetical protein ACKVUT_07390 [Gaiella sp.]